MFRIWKTKVHRTLYMTRVNFFITFLTGFMCMIFIGFLTQLNLPGLDGFSKKSIITIVSSLAFFDGYVIELLYVLLFGIWLINGNGYFRIFCYTLSFVFIVIYVIQLTVYYQSGEFLPRLAIENINHISLLLRNTSIIGVILFLVIFCCLFFYMLCHNVLIKALGEYSNACKTMFTTKHT